MPEDVATLVLRLAGPMQSWGTSSQFNRRSAGDRPSKSGVLGLLAAAQGRARGDDINDLLGLLMGVRLDQPGTVIHDFHTACDPHGRPLLSASVSAKGLQKPTGPKKFTHVSTRDYLSDAVFVVFLTGPRALLETLRDAIRRPRYPLALGRRSCPPAGQLVVPSARGDLWDGEVATLLSTVPWQAGSVARSHWSLGPEVTVAVSYEDPDGDSIESDVPVSFAPHRRGFTARRVRHGYVTLPTGRRDAQTSEHDAFACLGG